MCVCLCGSIQFKIPQLQPHLIDKHILIFYILFLLSAQTLLKDSVWESGRQTNSLSCKTFIVVVVWESTTATSRKGGELHFTSFPVYIPEFYVWRCWCFIDSCSLKHLNLFLNYETTYCVWKLRQSATSCFSVSGSSWFIYSSEMSYTWKSWPVKT